MVSVLSENIIGSLPVGTLIVIMWTAWPTASMHSGILAESDNMSDKIRLFYYRYVQCVV